MSQAQGYAPVLRNRNFLKLWIAQILSLMALQSLLLLALILIEQVNKSGLQTAGAIVAFSLPAVIFGPIAGVVLDRVPKKTILVVSNVARVVSQALLALLAYLGINKGIDPLLFVSLVYITIFFTSAIGQFFSPAEGSMIPLLVRREDLFAANSLFTLTIVGIQIIALILYVPIAVKAAGIFGAFVSLAFFYAAATLLLLLLPGDTVAERVAIAGQSALRTGWHEIGEGWNYVWKHRRLLAAVLQFSLVFTIVSILGELAPGYASRVLGMPTENAIYVFSPAGLGLVIASLVVVRFGPHLPRYILPMVGMTLMGVGLVGLGGLGLGGARITEFTIQFAGFTTSAIWLVGVVSLLAGIGLALVLIPAQTVIQEQSTDEVRGRVFTVQLTFANALSIPLLVAAGGLSDLFGIPEIIIVLGVILLPLVFIDWWFVHRHPEPLTEMLHDQPFPIAGETVTMLEDANPDAPALPAASSPPSGNGKNRGEKPTPAPARRKR